MQVVIGSVISTLKQKSGNAFWTLKQRAWQATRKVVAISFAHVFDLPPLPLRCRPNILSEEAGSSDDVPCRAGQPPLRCTMGRATTKHYSLLMLTCPNNEVNPSA